MRAYNSEKYIPAAINSFLCQTYDNKELIIVDDCSTDKTTNIAVEFASKHPNIHFTNEHIMGVNSGPGHTFLKVAKIALGMAKPNDIICMLDDDDAWADENALKDIVHRMDQTKANICFIRYEYHYENDDIIVPRTEVLKHNSMLEKLSLLNYAPTIEEQPIIGQARSAMCSRAYEAKVFRKYISMFPKITSEHRLCEDATTISPLLLKGIKFTGVNRATYRVNKRNGSVTCVYSGDVLRKRLLFVKTAKDMVLNNLMEHVKDTPKHLALFLDIIKQDLSRLVRKQTENGNLIGYTEKEFLEDFLHIVFPETVKSNIIFMKNESKIPKIASLISC